LKILSIKEEV